MLVFIDESGKPHPNDSTTNPVLCGVCIKESDIKYISQSIFRLKMNVFGKDTEIKSTSLINRRVIVKNMTKNKFYLDEFVKIVCGFDVKVFSIIMEKPDNPLIMSENKLPKHYLLLVKRAEYFCENNNIEKAILVFDESKTNDDLLIAKRIVKFLFMSKLGKNFKHVLEMPFFVNS
ncbi:MAG: DUF3800 domain-containing protein, partial [Clostridiales bacterium]|nr:DUF3800 domain-containing protein [Clostridiales bacterium]